MKVETLKNQCLKQNRHDDDDDGDGDGKDTNENQIA